MKFIRLMMLGLLSWTALMFVYLLTTAYLSPAKGVVMNINNYGEANMEMWLMNPLVLISAAYLLYEEFKEKKHE